MKENSYITAHAEKPKYMIHSFYCSYSNENIQNIQNCSKDADYLVEVSQIKVYR